MIAVVAAVLLVVVIVVAISGGDGDSPAPSGEAGKATNAGPRPKKAQGAPRRRAKLVALPAAIEPRTLELTAPVVRLSKPKFVRVLNRGTARITLGQVHLEGANKSDFVATDGCNGSTISRGKSCRIVVSFIPSRRPGAGARRRTAALILSDDGKGGKQTISLRGTVTP